MPSEQMGGREGWFGGWVVRGDESGEVDGVEWRCGVGVACD